MPEGRVLALVDQERAAHPRISSHGGDPGCAVRRARRRALVVGARATRAGAHEARPSPASVSREVHPAARRGAPTAPRRCRRARARPVRGLRHDARPVARERARGDRDRPGGVQLPADAGQDGPLQPLHARARPAGCARPVRAWRGVGRRGDGIRRDVVRAAGGRGSAALPLADRRVRERRRAADRARAGGALGAADHPTSTSTSRAPPRSSRTGVTSTSANAARSSTPTTSCGATHSTR